MGCPAAIDGEGRSIREAVQGAYIVSLTQLLLAYLATREWLVTGRGWSLLQAVFFGVMTIVTATLGYVKRNSPTNRSSGTARVAWNCERRGRSGLGGADRVAMARSWRVDLDG